MTRTMSHLAPTRRILSVGALLLSTTAIVDPVRVQDSMTPSPTLQPAPTSSTTPASTLSPEPPPSETPTVQSATVTETTTLSQASATLSASSTPADTRIDTVTPSSTPSMTPSQTAAAPASPSPTNESMPTPTPRPESFPAGSVLISEVAWAGTRASSNDEWIELYNPGAHTIDLDGWVLTDEDDIHVALEGEIPPHGFYLLERTDESTISNLSADHLYTGSLKNGGESLNLFDPSGGRIDSANRSGGSWPVGDSDDRFSMERVGGDDHAGNWQTFAGAGGNGADADGRPINGTPRQPNSVWFDHPPTTTPMPTHTPTEAVGIAYPPLSILINEVAWAGTVFSASDEWIELYNNTEDTIELSGWTLSDNQDIHVNLSGMILPRSYFLLERSDDNTVSTISADQLFAGSLRNSGESLMLRDPSGASVDTADGTGGWPAGDSQSRSSMERLGGEDRHGNWVTFGGGPFNAKDAGGNFIPGTPRMLNAGPLPSATLTPTPAAGSTASQGDVLINEVAWSGTQHSASDEWIELHNTIDQPVNLAGWSLKDGHDIEISLAGSIEPGGYYLLERTDDYAVSDVDADQIYSGSLSNSGERLSLFDARGALIDSANRSGGSWPAGNSKWRASMERRGGMDVSGNWGTFTGYFGIGHDASGGSIQGSPRGANSLHFPTPRPTWIPGKVVINEVLIRPHYDWQGTGGVSTDDEFIELYNAGPLPVNLKGWSLDDVIDGGSSPFELPEMILADGEFVAFFRSRTHIALNDTGDDVHLLNPSGKPVDSISYRRTRAANLSFGRLPDGSDHLSYGLWPTAREPNLSHADALQGSRNIHRMLCAESAPAALRIPRLNRPALGRLPSWTIPQLVCHKTTETVISTLGGFQRDKRWRLTTPEAD